MVKSKSSVTYSLFDTLKRIDADHPVIETKWAVEEVRPAYNTGGYYDTDVPEESRIVSPYLGSKEEAQAWMDEHEADDGKFLAVVKLTGREYRHIQWSKVRII